MIQDFAPKLARVLTEYSVPIQKGDVVVIMSSTEAAPLIEALYEAVLLRGGHPIVQAHLPNLDEISCAWRPTSNSCFATPSRCT